MRASAAVGKFVLKNDLPGDMLGDHGDELAVCGFALIGGDGAAEDPLPHFFVPAIPRQLDRPPHGALYAGGCCRESFRDFGIEDFCNSCGSIRVAEREEDGFT